MGNIPRPDLSSPHVPIHWGKCGRLENYIGETHGVHENATSYVHILFTIHSNDLVLKAWKTYFSSMSGTDMFLYPPIHCLLMITPP
jgi:hypothetical protein